MFDCGIRTDWAAVWPDAYQEIAWYDDAAPEVYFEHVLKSAGYGPEDFRYVFISHLHADHAGGLSLFQRADVPVLVHEDELKGALRLEADEEFYVRGDYDLPGVNWTPLYGEREILRGVTAIEVPGHTWGTMALRVETRNGPLILSSDACIDLEAYGPPAVSSLSNMDHEGYLASVEKIRRRAAADNARLVFGHDRCCAAHSKGKVTHEDLRYWPNGHY
jgi:glyoxylase-like metal-dependent hydrolase (beta-lactamase superfamily II)